MAIVISMGERRSKQQLKADKDSLMRRWLEKPFYDAEMHRVEMSRVDHPSQSNEIAIDLLYVWAASYICIASYWFVKYII